MGKKILKGQKDKSERFEKIFQILSIYEKYLMGENVKDEEKFIFQSYCKNYIYQEPQFNTLDILQKDPNQFLSKKDYSCGDLILEFLNPDEQSKQYITYQEAMNFFQQVFGNRTNIELKNEQLDYAILQTAFQLSFIRLKDCKKFEDYEFKSIQLSSLNAAIKLFFDDNDIINSIIDSNKKIEYNNQIKNIQKQILEQLHQKSQRKKEEALKDKKNSQPYYKKYFYGGHYLKIVGEGLERSKFPVNDFSTLARNLIILKLCLKGFRIKQFVSTNRKSIFVRLYAAETNIQFVAQTIKMKKFLNLEMTDLLSLEPIDSNFRPLRLNNRLWRSEQDIEIPQSEYFKTIKPEIVELLKKINFKKMAKEVHIQNLNDQMFDYGQRDLIDDEIGPTDEVWEAYYKYLKYLEQQVTDARKQYYFKQEFSVQLNPKRIIPQKQINLEKKNNNNQQKNKHNIKNTQQHTQRVTNSSRRIKTEEEVLVSEKEFEQEEKQKKQFRRFQLYLKQVDARLKLENAQSNKYNRKHTKEIQLNDYIICNTYKLDFNSILISYLKNLLFDILEINIEGDIDDEKAEFYLMKIYQFKEDKQELFDELTKNQNHDNSLQMIIQFIQDPKNIENMETFKQSLNGTISESVQFKSLKQLLIEKLFYIELEKEEKEWEDKILMEKQQFNNTKKILHLKQQEVCTKFLKERRRELLAQNYGNAMREGIKIFNAEKNKILLKSIWDFSFKDVDNILLSSEYSVAGKDFSFKKKNKMNTIWKKYQVSESGKISIFSIMERLKLAHCIVNQTINLPFLFTENYVLQLFALNDHYELYGISNTKLFQKDGANFQQTSESQFDETLKLHIEQTQIAESLFVQPKLFNLREIWKTNFIKPWHVPSDDIRNYYGEKIALYFTFLGHYTYSLLYPGIFGLTITIIQVLTGANVAITFGMIYGICNSAFISVLLNSWRLREKQIVAQFAQNQQQKNQQQEQRPAFKGKYRRDPQNDEFNTLYYPFSKLIIQMIINISLLSLIFSIYLGSVIGLFYMTRFFDDYNIFDGLEKLSFLKLEVSIPCIINVILLNIFETFYEKLAKSMTQNENHKTPADYESNYIIKKFTLLMLSYLAPIFMISFLNDELGINCAFNDCYLNASYYFASIFIILFFFNIKEVLEPIINQFLSKKKLRKQKTLEDQNKVFIFIETESVKSSYFHSPDHYGTVDEYMEIIIQSGLLALFAPYFPASMFIGFIWNALELQTDKTKLLTYTQRPIPLDEQSIGIWGYLLEFLANFSIIYNTGVVYIMGKSIPDRNDPENPPVVKDVTMFIIIILISFTLRFILETLFPDATYDFISIMKRQNYLFKSTIEIFKKKQSKAKVNNQKQNQLSRYILFKPYGASLKQEKKKRLLQQVPDEEDEYDDEYFDQFNQIKQKEPQQAAQVQQIILEQEQNQQQQIFRNVYYFDFPLKKQNHFHLQRTEEQKVRRLQRMLNDFEKNYNLKWCEQRFLYRRLIQSRRQQLYRFLSVQKLKAFLISYKELFNRFKKSEEQKRQTGILDNQEELEEKNARIDYIAKKKAKQSVRQVVILKSRGVWFNQFRRTIPILRASEMIVYLRKQDILQNREINKVKLIPINSLKITKDGLLKNRQKIFSEIKKIDIAKTYPSEILKTIVQSKTQYSYVPIYKTQMVRNIEELYSLKTQKIYQIQTQIHHIEFPDYLSCSQEELKYLFLQYQKAQLRENNFKLIKLIEKDKQNEIWLIKQDYQLKILEAIEIQVNQTNTLYKNLIMQEYSLFDQFFYPQGKGMIAKIVDSKYELLNGWTLFDTIKLRKTVQLYYLEEELLLFFYNLLQSFKNNIKDQLIITPKSIYANRNGYRLGYTFNWKMQTKSDIQYNLFLSKEQNETNVSQMIYNAGMIISYMISLGDIQENQDYLIEKQAIIINKYPRIYSIIQDMLLSKKQRKTYQYIFELCSNECQTKGVFLEDQRITQQIINESKMLETNYDEVRIYDQNELTNQLETQQIHLIISQQLYKLTLLFKLKYIEQFKEELDQTFTITRQLYKNDNYLQHMLGSLNYYCDKPFHQKLMIDFINLELILKIYEVYSNFTLNGIIQGEYEPKLKQVNEFMDQIYKYTTNEILTDYDQQSDILIIKKRLRVQANNYQTLHQQLNQIKLKFLFLKAQGEMFQLNNSQAQKLFQEILDKNNNPLRTIVIQINIGKTQQMRQQQIEYLSSIQCNISHYNLKISCLLIKLNLQDKKYFSALQLCNITKPQSNQCFFDQILHQQILLIHSQIQWCLNNYQNNYDYLKYWINMYKEEQNKDIELPLLGLINFEYALDLLYYNQDIHLIEDYLAIIYKYIDKNIFIINYILFKLLQIINLQLGTITFGIITQYDKNSNVGEQRMLIKCFDHLPKIYIRKNDYLSCLYFEIECNLQLDIEDQMYLYLIEDYLIQRRSFILAKLHFAKQQYSQTKNLLEIANNDIQGLIGAWKMKNSRMIDLNYDYQFQLQDLSWQSLFVSLVFDLTILNAQLVCQFAFKLLELTKYQQQNEGQELLHQFKTFFVKLLLEEYNNKENEYIEKSFEIKFFILNSLNQYIQDLSLTLLSNICDIQDNIRKKQLVNYQDITIPLDEREVEKKTICLNDLFVVQSQLLEENGDPVAALKCLDVEYALILYEDRFNQQIQQVFNRKFRYNDPILLNTKCKIAIIKVFLNLFEPSLHSFIQIKKIILASCKQIVDETAEEQNIQLSKDKNIKIIWDELELKKMEFAKPKQLEIFQKYKLLYYQVEWKLLELYSIKGDFKEAYKLFVLVYSQYLKLEQELQNIPDKQYILGYFEYSLAVYLLAQRQITKAYYLFKVSANRFQKKETASILRYVKQEMCNAQQLTIIGDFYDKFTNDNLIKDLLNQFNHLFTITSRSRIYRNYCELYSENNSRESGYQRLFQSLLQLLENIRKTMGRQSILYVDALMVYIEYILKAVQEKTKGFLTFKLAFREYYFYTRKESEFFEPYIFYSKNKFKFLNQDDIEDKLTEQLLVVWVVELSEQCLKFYKEYFQQVNVSEHFNIIYCYLIQFKISFLSSKIYQAEYLLDTALNKLEKICPTQDHPYGIMIYEGYALLCENLEAIQEENVKLILECNEKSHLNRLNVEDRTKICKDIYLRNEQICKFFDEYKTNQFEYYLFEKLEKYLDPDLKNRKASQKQQKQNKLPKLTFDQQFEIKQQALEYAKKNQDQIIDKKLKIGVMGYYRKAYRICKTIFKEPNELYIRIEKKFIELSIQESKDNFK